ncbi:MAG TPA: diguanylate cyclase [Bacillota bacterium]
MNKTDNPIEPTRFILTAASIELLMGLSVYALPVDLLGPLSPDLRGFVTAPMSTAGILLLLLVRYRLPRWGRWAVLGFATFTLGFGAARLAMEGLWMLAFLEASLVCTLLAVAALPHGIGGVVPDFTYLFLALTELLSGAAMLIRPEVFLYPTFPPVRASTTWVGAAVLAGGVLLTLRRDGTKSRMWLIRPLRHLFYLRPWLAAVLPILMFYDQLWLKDIQGLLAWVIFLAAIPWPKGVLMLGPVEEEDRATPGGEAADSISNLERTLEIWTWLLALALVFWSALQGSHRAGPTGAEEVFTLALVAWNIVAFWVLRGRVTPGKRLAWQLLFLATAVGVFQLTARDRTVAYIFAGLLIVIPSLWTRAFGTKSGWRLLGSALAMIALGGLKSWAIDGLALGAAMGETLIELFVLALAGGMAVRSAGEQRHLAASLDARAQELSGAQETLRQSEEKFRMAFTHAAIGKALISPTGGRFLAVNQALSEMLGYSEVELLEMTDEALLHPEERQSGHGLLARLRQGPVDSVDLERRYLNSRGETVWTQVTASPIRGADGAPQCLVVEIQDITARKQVESQLVHQANHDSLTNLHNRRRFREDLERQLRLVERYGYRGAVIYLDLDGFKEVNDAFGHQAGDIVLVSLAEALEAHLRKTDTVARIGGDEFAVLLPAAGPARAGVVAEHILGTVSGHVTLIGSRPVRVTASLGVAMYPDDGRSPDELLSRADIALFEAKRSRNCYVFYRPEMAEAAAGPGVG